MKVYIRHWDSKPPALTTIATVNVGAYEGVSFRDMPKGEEPALSTNFKGLRVTEIFLHASEPNALCVYVEGVDK